MKKQLTIKLIISILIILIAINFIYVNSSMALGNVVNDGKNFLDKGNDIYTKINKTALQDTSNMIYNTFLAMGIIAAVIIGMVIGIKIMVASADEKAKVKESLLPFVIGCIVIFGSFTIWKVVITIGNDAESVGVDSFGQTATYRTISVNDEIDIPLPEGVISNWSYPIFAFTEISSDDNTLKLKALTAGNFEVVILIGEDTVSHTYITVEGGI